MHVTREMHETRPILELVEIVQNEDADPGLVRRVLRELLGRDATIGITTALEILARDPRFRPSRELLIDPANDALRHWGQRVAAGAALLESSVLPRVRDEVEAELAECADFAADVRFAVDAPDQPAIVEQTAAPVGAEPLTEPLTGPLTGPLTEPLTEPLTGPLTDA